MNIYLLIADRNNIIDNIRQKQTMLLWQRTLSERGHHAKIVDIAKDTKGELIKEINEKANITITWNSNCRDVRFGAGNFYLNELKTKNLCRLTEHPVAFFLDYWNTRGSNQYYITCNARHNKIIEEQKLGNVVNTCSLTALKSNKKKSLSAKKEFSIVIAAQNRGDPQDLIFWADKSRQTKEFYESIVKQALFNDKTDVYTEYKNKLEALQKTESCLIDHQFPLKKLYWIQKKIERYEAIDRAINNFKGKKLMIGDWEGKYGGRDDVEIVAHVSPQEITDAYSRGRAILCINELDGGNERAAEARHVGTHSIGDAWLYTNRTQPDALELLFEATNLTGDHLTERVCDEDSLIKCVESI